MKKKIALILAIISAFSFCACQQSEDSSSSSLPSEDVIPPVSEDNALVFVGGTDYKIVLAADGGNSNDSVAASELNTFVSEATGVKFPIVTDGEVSDASSGKYISIGHTDLAKSAGITVDNEALYRSGFVIRTIDDDVYLLGSTDKFSSGSIYAVYDYLHEILNYEYYAPGCYELNYTLSVAFPEVNKTEIPDIPTRSMAMYNLVQNADYSMRMRLERNAANGLWIAAGHSINDMANPSSYGTDHPDWFTADLIGHCFSSDGLRDHLIQQVKQRIESNLEGIAYIVQIGQADTTSFCNCETCKEEIETKYMTQGGQLLGLINEISDAITPWLQEVCPDKEILFTTFAYQYSENPPCIQNEETGEWEPFSEYVIPRDNVGVYWAPIEMDYSKPITDESSALNVKSMKALQGWKVLTDNILLWSYCINFRSYMINFDNFGSIAENYKVYAEYGVKYIYDQGAIDSGLPTFEELRIYIQSKLMWDTSLNINDLIRDFMNHYYGPASDEILTYFNKLNAYYDYLQSKSLLTGMIFYYVNSTEIWPIGIVNGFANDLDIALKAIENANIKAEDKTEYTNRVNRLYCTLWYLYISNFNGYFTQSQIEEITAKYEYTCNLYNIIRTSE